MRDDHEAGAHLAIQFEHEVQDVLAVAGIEVARRLVREHDARVVHERPGDGDALPLAAREFARAVVHTVTQADALERVLRALAPRFRRLPRVDEREFDVDLGGRPGQLDTDG